MQWHYDTFDLPHGAQHLARSDGCAAQAFAWGEHLVALQFHPEMTRKEVARVIERDGPVPDGPGVSDAATMLVEERFDRLRARTHAFLDRLTASWFGDSPPVG